MRAGRRRDAGRRGNHRARGAAGARLDPLGQLQDALVELVLRFVPLGVDAETAVDADTPPWFQLGLLGLATLGWLTGLDRLTRFSLYVAATSATLLLVLQVITLILLIPARTGTAGGEQLLLDALLLWTGTTVLFALWHWMLDAGGPWRRGTPLQARSDLQFPQRQEPDIPGWQGWQPQFGDYLFVAFSVGATFSTSDTPVLAWRAKLLVMLQALLAVIILVVLAARAINVISNGPPIGAAQSSDVHGQVRATPAGFVPQLTPPSESGIMYSAALRRRAAQLTRVDVGA